MKVCGFTFIRNALKYDYPIVEAITSILPICDLFIVAVGQSHDGTLALIQSIADPKIQILHTTWDDTLKEGGKVLAAETDKALRQIPPDYDWAFYIQGDEVVHEQYLPLAFAAMQRHKDDPTVDGLLFAYQHFYGSYSYIGNAARWYRHEIRIIRPRPDIFSYRDAQGFRKQPNQKLRVRSSGATVYHYGWVRPPATMLAKVQDFDKLWHGEPSTQLASPASDFDYSQVDSLALFTGTHPLVMQPRVAQKNWTFDHDISIRRLRLKDRLKHFARKYLGLSIGEYKNYVLLK